MMIFKDIMMKFLMNVDTKLQPKPRSIQQATPRSIACFLVGYQLYYRIIDHNVKKQLSIQKGSQKVYSDLLINSEKSGIYFQNLLLTAGFLSSLYASYETKNKFWMFGGSIFISMIAFDYFFLKPIKNDIIQMNQQEKLNITEKLLMKNTQKRLSYIKRWKQMYNYKIGLGILTILIFYIAELSQSQKVNLKLSYKK